MKVATRARYIATGFDARAPWAPTDTLGSLRAMVDSHDDPLGDWHVLDDRRLFTALAAAGVDDPELSAYIDDRRAFDDLIDRALS